MNKSLKVPYTEENIGRCMCPECPVLAGSECVGTKLKSPRDEMRSLEKGDTGIRVGKQEPGGIFLQERKGKVTIGGFLAIMNSIPMISTKEKIPFKKSIFTCQKSSENDIYR